VFDAYAAELSRPGGPLDATTIRVYASRVRQYLAWLAMADVDGDPLAEPAARDWAVRDYRTHLLTIARRKPATVNAHLTAIDDFYRRRRLGPATAKREDLPNAAPRALSRKAQLRWLRAAEQASPRDRAIALAGFYAGLRIAEIVALDLTDLRISARKGHLIVRYSKGGHYREVPLHPVLHKALDVWLTARKDQPAGANPAVFLNRRGERLSTRGAYNALAAIAEAAGIAVGRDAEFTPHVLRHTARHHHDPGRDRHHHRGRNPRPQRRNRPPLRPPHPRRPPRSHRPSHHRRVNSGTQSSQMALRASFLTCTPTGRAIRRSERRSHQQWAGQHRWSGCHA